MEKQEEVSKIQDYLGNLEGTLFRLEDLENLLIILEENYFEKGEIDLYNTSDMYSLWRDYKYNQSLLFTINYCIRLYNSKLKENIYKIYDSVKVLKSQITIDNKSIVNLNQISA